MTTISLWRINQNYFLQSSGNWTFDPDRSLLKVATFLNLPDAQFAAYEFARYQIFDYQIIQGRRKTKYRSKRVNRCPVCGAEHTYADMIHRKPWGNFRCDCGCLFVIDWDFPFNPTQRPIVDISSPQTAPFRAV